jgi:hypothetical protein
MFQELMTINNWIQPAQTYLWLYLIPTSFPVKPIFERLQILEIPGTGTSVSICNRWKEG